MPGAGGGIFSDGGEGRSRRSRAALRLGQRLPGAAETEGSAGVFRTGLEIGGGLSGYAAKRLEQPGNFGGSGRKYGRGNWIFSKSARDQSGPSGCVAESGECLPAEEGLGRGKENFGACAGVESRRCGGELRAGHGVRAIE